MTHQKSTLEYVKDMQITHVLQLSCTTDSARNVNFLPVDPAVVVLGYYLETVANVGGIYI